MQNIANLQEIRNSARIQLEHAMFTNRGTTEARKEAKRVLKDALSTCRCQSCGAPLTWHPKMNGYCRTCNARFDRLLCFKSNIKRTMPTEKALRRFIEDYSVPAPLPYALRGNAPKELIITYATDLLAATIAIHKHIMEVHHNDQDM